MINVQRSIGFLWADRVGAGQRDRRLVVVVMIVAVCVTAARLGMLNGWRDYEEEDLRGPGEGYTVDWFAA